MTTNPAHRGESPRWTDEDRAEFNAWLTSAADGPADECPLCASHPDHPCLFHNGPAEYPEREPGFLLGYCEGWNDAKAGRQYGEGRWGQRSGVSGPAPSCGVISMSGPNGEPLGCGFFAGHDGAHSWATLPTFHIDGPADG